MSTMSGLLERPVSFRYGYNMKCGNCDRITPLSATTYYREQSHSARIKCAYCSCDIHYGPLALALRDARDPVLDNQVALGTAWYHTSTDPYWPTRGRKMSATEFAAVVNHVPEEDAERVRERHEHQALHLGTYEAAVESMLRKMRDEGMAGERFWLYRVALGPDVTIEPGYRNENMEEISQITQAELDGSGAIRYLNTWESPGSLSLAAHPRSIRAVQGIALPVEGLGAGATPALGRKIKRIKQRISQIGRGRQDKPDHLEKLRQRVAARQGAVLGSEPTQEQYRLLEEICKLIRCEYLPRVSLTVRERFSDAMLAWAESQEPPPDDVPFMERFATMAAILTRPDDIHRALDSGTPRQL